MTPVDNSQHFKVFFNEASFTAADGQRIGQAILQRCELDYSELRFIFSGTEIPNPITVTIENGAGGINNGQDMTIRTGVSDDFDYVRTVFVDELAEIFMANQNNKQWHPRDSKGEALSRVLGGLLYPGGRQPGFTVHQWVDNDPDGLTPSKDEKTGPEGLEDWINKTEDSDTRAKSVGCGVAFIHYLHYQLGISFQDIVAQSGATLQDVYSGLILAGKVPSSVAAANGFEPFVALVRRKFPKGTPSGLNALNKWPNSDQFFPLEIYLDVFVLGQDNMVRTASRDGAGWHWSTIDGAAFNQGNPITALRNFGR